MKYGVKAGHWNYRFGTDRANAERIAQEVGGTVVEFPYELRIKNRRILCKNIDEIFNYLKRAYPLWERKDIDIRRV